MNSLYQLDIKCSKLLNGVLINNKSIIKILKFLTHSSDGRTYLFYVIMLPFIFPGLGFDIAKVGIISFAFQVPTYLLLKNTIKRRRPSLDHNITALMKPPDKYSFPSGHCASSMLMTLIMIDFFSQGYFLIIWLIIIFFSRVSLGLHYISDVICGALLGILSYNIAIQMLSSSFFQ